MKYDLKLWEVTKPTNNKFDSIIQSITFTVKEIANENKNLFPYKFTDKAQNLMKKAKEIHEVVTVARKRLLRKTWEVPQAVLPGLKKGDRILMMPIDVGFMDYSDVEDFLREIIVDHVKILKGKVIVSDKKTGTSVAIKNCLIKLVKAG